MLYPHPLKTFESTENSSIDIIYLKIILNHLSETSLEDIESIYGLTFNLENEKYIKATPYIEITENNNHSGLMCRVDTETSEKLSDSEIVHLIVDLRDQMEYGWGKKIANQKINYG